MRSAKHAGGRDGKNLNPGMATEGSGGSTDSPSLPSCVDLASLAGHASEFWLNHFSLRFGALLLAGLIVQGCSLKQPNPAKHSFLLEAVRTGAARPDSRPAQLRLRNIHVAAPFEGKGFVYRTSELGYKVDFYNEFLTAPRALISAQLQTWLSASKVFQNVLPSGSAIEPTHVLEGNVTALYGDFRDVASPKAVLAIEFFLTREQAPSGGIVFHHSYRQEVTIENRAAETLAKGWGRALGQILTSLEQDLAALTK